MKLNTRIADAFSGIVQIPASELMTPTEIINRSIRKLAEGAYDDETYEYANELIAVADDAGVEYDRNLVEDQTESHTAKIRLLAAGGKSALDIAKKLNIELNTVHRLMSDHKPDDPVRVHKIKQRVGESISDSDIDNLAAQEIDDSDIFHIYDSHELIVDDEVLDEAITRAQRIKMRLRFMRTKASRQRKAKIALHRHSNMGTLTNRAKKLAIKMIKQKLLKKPFAEFSVADKERAEKMIANKKSAVKRLSIKLISRIRDIERKRLSHKKETK